MIDDYRVPNALFGIAARSLATDEMLGQSLDTLLDTPWRSILPSGCSSY